MARRRFPLALAVVVAATPVLGEICEARCARHDEHVASVRGRPLLVHHHESGGTQGAHHHFASADPQLCSISAVRFLHVCDYRDLVSTRTRAARPLVLDVALSTVGIAQPAVRASSSTAFENRHGPPGPVRSTSPLRI